MKPRKSNSGIPGFLYGTKAGRIILKPLISQRFSEFAGKILSTRFSGIAIGPFIRKNGIDMSIYEKKKYGSFNEFFSRKIISGAREIDMDPCHFISPCDSSLTVVPITEDGAYLIKDTPYTAESLLRNRELAEEYYGGRILIFRLSVTDYHRYCFACSGTTHGQVKIPGVFHTVQPIANDFFPVYKENTREYCIEETDRFGTIIQMEVGALMVGKIVNHDTEDHVERGQEKGFFRFGGSTVIIMVKKGLLNVDARIMDNSRENIETKVNYGEKIGEAANSGESH